MIIMTLETKLNKLIELGWKPWDFWYIWHIRITNNKLLALYGGDDIYYYSLNDLCSIDSWLWQFVCEKWLYIQDYHTKTILLASDWMEDSSNYEDDYKYRLMLSSIQKDKEKFLLDNIKLPDGQTTDDR